MGGRVITYLIAEAGTGHAHDDYQWRVDRARRLINAAKISGFDAVKFQLFVPDEPLFCPLPGDDDRWERWNRTMITLDDWKELSKTPGIDVMWSVFQQTSLDWLIFALQPRYIKVASRAAHCFPYHSVKPESVIVSLGLGGASAVPKRAYRLKCVTKYPAPLEESGWSDTYDGFSDHSGTIYPGLDAIAHNAKFLEVHFRLPFQEKSNDDAASLRPEQLKVLSEARNAFARMHPR